MVEFFTIIPGFPEVHETGIFHSLTSNGDCSVSKIHVNPWKISMDITPSCLTSLGNLDLPPGSPGFLPPKAPLSKSKRKASSNRVINAGGFGRLGESNLVGGWTVEGSYIIHLPSTLPKKNSKNNPIWKICGFVKLGIYLPQIGDENKKYLSCHHPAILILPPPRLETVDVK